MAMNHRRYIAWFRLTARVLFGTFPERHTGRSLRFRWWVIPFNHTGCIRDAPGTAHRPFPTVSLVGGTVHPHRLYSLRCMAMNHRRYIAWFHSTAQVVFDTWRAASSRPYWCNTIHPHGLYSQRPRNGTQAVPYNFTDWCIFLQNVFQKRVRSSPIIVNC